MSLLTPAGIRQRALKHWESQRFLRAWLAGDAFTPLEIPLGTPSGSALAERFAEVRAWVTALRAESKEARGQGYRLVEQEVAHRLLGPQRLPVRAVIDTPEDLLRLAGKRQAFARFEALAAETRARLPALETHLAAKPLASLALEASWAGLLAVCEHFARHPRPGCYTRELDVPGVDSKFIEGHEAVLWELLPLVLPLEALDLDVGRRDAHAFERRFGLRHDPPLVRFRTLDAGAALPNFSDLAVPLADFAAWAPAQVDTVFVTENKVNGLAFPPAPRAIVVFGLGYGVQALREVPWLATRRLVYWGDLDTHGFAILAQLRAIFPHTVSLLMDEATLLAHRQAWGQEPEARRCLRDLAGLSAEEQAVFEGLRTDAWGARVRLEQERLTFGWVARAVADARATR